MLKVLWDGGAHIGGRGLEGDEGFGVFFHFDFVFRDAALKIEVYFPAAFWTCEKERGVGAFGVGDLERGVVGGADDWCQDGVGVDVFFFHDGTFEVRVVFVWIGRTSRRASTEVVWPHRMHWRRSGMYPRWVQIRSRSALQRGQEKDVEKVMDLNLRDVIMEASLGRGE